MKLFPQPQYAAQLKALWQTVFGDEPGYIDLFFSSVWQTAHTFAAEENGELVSALYLLDCEIVCGGAHFDGFYLYAAATHPAHRKRGHMARLIEEAKAFAKAYAKAFIALVPANDGLYDYYARFGFFPAMAQYVGTASAAAATLRPVSAAQYYAAACDLPIDRFLWTKVNHAYALACLAYYDCLPYESDDGVLLTDGTTVKEALAKTPDALQRLLAQTAGETHVPFALPGFAKRRFGMIYTEHAALQTLRDRPIYMNLALD